MVKFGNRGKGIACIIASAFGFALMAFFVRLCDDFGGEITCFQKSFFRNVLALVIAFTVFCRDRRHGPASNELQTSMVPSGKAWALLVLRAIFGTVGIFEGDGTKIVLESQLVSASVADAEPVRFAIEAVFLGLECDACNDCKGEK